MNILISNDDGINSMGITSLYDVLRKSHNVYIVAPDGERSANSHKLTVRQPIDVKQIEKNIYSLSGTPADCVKFALQHLYLDVDLVVGGINRGSNVGSDIMYSGTCAVAREAVYLKSKAVSLSLDHGEKYDFTLAVDFVKNNVETIYSVLDNKTFLNVNFPNGKPFLPPKFCAIGDLRYSDLFSCDSQGKYVLAGTMRDDHNDEETDVQLLKKGHVTLTPIYPFKEDFEAIEKYNEKVKFI